MKTIHSIQSIIESGHNEESAPAVLALCQHLDCSPEAVSRERHDHYDMPVYSAEGGEYAVASDSEAADAVAANIKDSIWAFNASFILDECGLPNELEDAISAFQQEKCESANDALLALVEKCAGTPRDQYQSGQDGLSAFVQSAISADGRGHFLSGYDGQENEELVEMPEGDSIRFYIYRTN
jgi:hypothetical protein